MPLKRFFPMLMIAGCISVFGHLPQSKNIDISLPVPDEQVQSDIKYRDLSWKSTDTTLTLLNEQEIIWQYNYRTRYSKDFFHPLRTSAGTISCLAPSDHPWHLGLWFSWKYINGVNYWEANRKTLKSDGTTEIKDIEITTHPDYSAQIDLEVEYHNNGKPPVLREKRTIHVSTPQNDGYFIDYVQTFAALEDVFLDRTPIIGESGGKTWGGYAGLSMRFSQDIRNVVFTGIEPMENYNESKGDWLFMGGEFFKGGKAGVCIYQHPYCFSENMRWYVTNTTEPQFQYFSPAIIFNAPLHYNAGEKFTLKYRVWVVDGVVSARELNEKYKEFAQK